VSYGFNVLLGKSGLGSTPGRTRDHDVEYTQTRELSLTPEAAREHPQPAPSNPVIASPEAAVTRLHGMDSVYLERDLPPADRRSATVLCIDDDPEIPWAVGAYLANYGIHVLKAFHGTQGFELARLEQPGAILIDQGMPQGRGDTIIECLKREPRTEHIPILVLTGQRSERLERRLFELGVEGVLMKPVRLNDLLSAIRPLIPIRETLVGRTPVHESNNDPIARESPL
jgi:twitching motility two-component system response regulator PilH